MSIRLIFGLLFAGVLTGCLKEEIPVSPQKPGSLKKTVIAMESDYRFQVYYNLETDKVVGKHLKTAWDLGFSCSDDNFIVRLNTAKFMMATVTSHSDLKSVTDTTGTGPWKSDGATGSEDSLSLADFEGTSKVFLIDAGYNEKGQLLGLYKFRVDSISENSYYFSWSELSSLKIQHAVIKKNKAVNQVLFSLIEGRVSVDQEPEKSSWDLIFTQFTQTLEVSIPYLITGVRINPYKTLAVQDSLHRFDAINRTVAENTPLTNRWDVPGFNWKTYDFDLSSYIVHTEKSYLIYTSEGFYWKLRFLDFYNDLGQSGFPAFETQRL